VDEKAEFLADISSFANASGGDIIFGISDERDENGRPTGVPDVVKPLVIGSPATECARIEQLIESGVQPRIPAVHVKHFNIPNCGLVIVVRVGKSWLAPHMISYANRTRFFSRNSSTGKVQLDVQQIGAAFAQQRGLGERLRVWKMARISKAIAGEGPISLEGSKVLFHFISAAALTDEGQSHPRIFDVQKLILKCKLFYMSAQAARYNADGLLVHSTQTRDQRQSYLQIFLDGSLEYADSAMLESGGQPHVASRTLEEKIIQTYASGLELLKEIEAAEPTFVTLTLIGMKGRTMALPSNVHYNFDHTSEPFDRDIILCPDVLIENSTDRYPYPSTLLPIVNAVWQAAGLASTPYASTTLWEI
jgi:hypothetical protein